MLTFKLLFLPLAVASSASARLPVSQATRNRHANHTLVRPVENTRSAPPPPPSYQTNSNPNLSSPDMHARDNLENSLEGVHNVNEHCRCNAVELEAREDPKVEAGSALDCTMVYRDGGASVYGGRHRMKTVGKWDTLATLALEPTSTATTNSTSTLTTPAAWTTGPCIIDQASPRLLSHQIGSLMSNSPASCQSQCAANGYIIAGLRSGRECWCGNVLSVAGGQTPAGQVVSDSQCIDACPGGGANACGNSWRMRVYGLGSILRRYNLEGLIPTTSVVTSSAMGNTITPRSEVPMSPSANSTGSDSRTLPAKRVIAHHMVGNTHPYTLDTWSTDISLALGAGIDGFVLNVGSGGVGNWQREQVKNAYSAAAALSASGNTFGLFLSLDMTALGCANQNDAAIIRDYISTFGVHSAQLVLPPSTSGGLGRVLVSTFSGEDCQFGMGNANEGWKSVLQDATVTARLSTMGREVAFVPGWFTRVERRRSEFAGTVQGDFNWNGGWPMGNYDVNWDSDAYRLNYNPGPLFMTGVSPWFFTHYGPDSWNKNWIYRGDDWLYTTRWEMLISQRSQVDIAQIITWNDYGESSYIGPIEGDQPNSQAWTNHFPHDGWLKMTRFYANAFKSGAYPAITEDNVYIWSRPHSKDAWAADYVGRPHNAGWTDDYIWAVVFATKPAKLTLTSGPNSGQFSVITGVNKFKIPSGYGEIRATLADAITGLVSVDVNPGTAFTYTSSPSTYNFNAFVAWG